MTDRRNTIDEVLTQIRACLDAATSRPGLVKASVYQTEGYLRGLQGLAWETPAVAPPSSDDPAAVFLNDIRKGSVALRGRVKKDSASSVKAFLKKVCEAFPEAKDKPFLKALARLWVRWSEERTDSESNQPDPIALRLGQILKREYEEGIAGDLSAYLLDDRLHLRNVRDFLRMRGWLQGTIENLRRRTDWEGRERAGILAGNFASIVLRALHGADVNYASEAVTKLSAMIRHLDLAIERLGTAEPEAAHFLRKNRLTVLTRALHSGYLDYPEQAAKELPRALKERNLRIARIEASSPEIARNLRANLASAVYRALTNGRLASLSGLDSLGDLE